jgi:hypothetical protein
MSPASPVEGLSGHLSEEGVRLAQKMHVGPCIPVGMQRLKAEGGPTGLSHFMAPWDVAEAAVGHLGLYPIVTSQYSSTALHQVSYHIHSLFF